MTDHAIYDVVIIGTGPAGGKLAYNLGILGFKVLLIEKETLPRDKICAGGISGKAVREIGYSIDEVIEKRIIGSYFAFSNEHIIYKHLPGSGVTVDRAKLDHFMIQKAVGQGVELCQGTEFESYEEKADYVEIATSEGRLRAKVLVGADGVYSKVRKIMHPHAGRSFAHTIMARLYPKDGMLEAFGPNTMYDIGAISGGYGWIFPKADHFNIGLFKKKNSKSNMKMRDLLNQFISRNPVLRDYERIEIKAYPIPTRPISGNAAKGRVILIGDAAGLAENLFGEGIYYGVRSANIASNVIAGFLRTDGKLESYNRKIRSVLRDLFFSRLISGFVYRVPRFAYYQMFRNKFLNHLFSYLVHGGITHTMCFCLVLFSSPFWILLPKHEPISEFVGNHVSYAEER